VKISSKIEQNFSAKPAAGAKSARVKSSLLKTGQPAAKDRSKLSREKESRSNRKLGIIEGLKSLTSPAPKPRKKWTVLCYFAADCNLEPEMTGDLIDLEKVGSGKEMNILVQIDRGENPTLKLGGKPGSTSYYVTESRQARKITSKELEHQGRVDSSKPENLQDFLERGMKNYPAENYLVLVSGHGHGIGLLPDFGVSEPENRGMALPEFKQALQKAEAQSGVNKNQVLLGLDSCLMSQAEAAYELKDAASQMLASQAPITNDNWKMAQIFGTPGVGEMNLEKMAEHIYTGNIEGAHQANSLLDLKSTPQLGKALKGFVKAAQNGKTDPARLKAVIEAQTRSLNREEDGSKLGFYFSDLKQIASLVMKDREIKDPELKKAARGLLEALNKTVVKSSPPRELPHRDNYQGLGVFTNSDPKAHQEHGYEELELSRDTGWGEFMTHYSPQVTPGEVNRQLSEKSLAHPGLKQVAEYAEKLLPEIKSGTINSHQCFERFDRLTEDLINRDPDSEETLHALRRLMDQRVFGPVLQSPLPPRPIWEAGLETLCALKGEISSKTLAESARNLLAAEKTEPYRNPLYKDLLLDTGAGLLLDLGKATNNPKIIYLEGRYNNEPEKMLREIARLDKESLKEQA